MRMIHPVVLIALLPCSGHEAHCVPDFFHYPKVGMAKPEPNREPRVLEASFGAVNPGFAVLSTFPAAGPTDPAGDGGGKWQR